MIKLLFQHSYNFSVMICLKTTCQDIGILTSCFKTNPQHLNLFHSLYYKGMCVLFQQNDSPGVHREIFGSA